MGRESVAGRLGWRRLTQGPRSRPRTSVVVTMECAGTGGARLSPAVISQPWLVEAVGTASWTEGASLLRCDLLHHLQAVGFAPALDDPAVGDPHYVDAGEGDLSLGCRYAQLVSLVGAGCCPSHGHLVA